MAARRLFTPALTAGAAAATALAAIATAHGITSFLGVHDRLETDADGESQDQEVAHQRGGASEALVGAAVEERAERRQEELP
jgi:formate-dependent nitrite reductase cytochrome c552 subunit